MCSTCDDYTYAAYGGKWERADMVHGRVGSAFDDPGSPIFDGQEEMSAPHHPDEGAEPEGAEEMSEPPEPAAEFDETSETDETPVMLEDDLHSVLRVD